MTTQKFLLAIIVTGLTGCSSLLGLNKEPSLAADDQPAIDAAIDQMVPIDMSTIDMDLGPCGVKCDFGCDTTTNTCRAAKLWIFLSGGQFTANGFGGTDNPPDVRPTADGKCFATASGDFANRFCTSDRTHAIISVSGADPIGSMATKYNIPTTVTVHRADDDILVFNSWTDLTGTQAPQANPVSPAIAANDIDGIVWTGFGAAASNCSSWTTNASSANGVIGHTAGTPGLNATWLGTGSVPCNTGPLQHLLCVCWSGGN